MPFANKNPLKFALFAYRLPVVDILPSDVILPVANKNPPKLPLFAYKLPVVDILPSDVILPPANTNPLKLALFAIRLPLALILPVFKLPDLTLPVTLKLDSVPVLVMFGCAAVVSVPVR